MKNTEKTMDKIVALCKNRGFVFPGSEIYGGLANTWDYGPLGAELKKNIKNAWWKKFVQENPYNVGLDAAILMNPQTWVASGHLSGFSDPLMDCRECHERFRADKLIEDWCAETGFELPKAVDAFSQAEMKDFIEEHNIPCPTCGKHNFTDIRQFNLMFKTFQGVTEDAKNTVYLRDFIDDLLFVTLGHAAGHDQCLAFSGLFQFCHLQDGVHTLFFCVIDETAGIDHNDICLVFIVCKGMAVPV